MTDQVMVDVRGLTKRYGKLLALNDLSFQLYEGDLFGFIGPNGAGKTTTLRILATNLRHDSGQVSIAGFSLTAQVEKVRGVIGFMPDFLGIYDNLIVSDYLDFFARAYHLPAHLRSYSIKEAAALTMIEDLLPRPVESLSRGMKQRVGLARTLLHNPKILLLDEPASGLDPRARVEIRDIIKGLQMQGRTIIISSHILSDLADICNKVGIIEKGRMILNEDMNSVLNRITGVKNIRLRTLGSRSDIKIVLDENPEVSDLLWDGEDLTFAFQGSDEDLHKLLKNLMEHEIPIYNFSEVPGSLESAYIQITGDYESARRKPGAPGVND